MERWRKAIGKWIRWSETLNSRSTEKVAGKAHFTNVESPSASQTGLSMVRSRAADPWDAFHGEWRKARSERAKRRAENKDRLSFRESSLCSDHFRSSKGDRCFSCCQTEPTARGIEIGLEILERIVVTGTEWIRITRWSEWIRGVGSATVKRAATGVGGSSSCVGRCRLGCQRVVHRTFEGIV